jgi:trk/ktr system potassium uptake protein
VVHAVVVGCGRVGAGLAAALQNRGHSVSIVDRDPKAFRRLPGDFSGHRVIGAGFDRDRLTEAGIDEAKAVAAVTSGDNSNIVVARVAREAFKVERVVARIYDPRRAAIYSRLGIPTIASVQWTTDRILRHVLPDGAAIEWSDPAAKVCLIERSVPEGWAGHPLGDLEIEGKARIVALTRAGSSEVPTPTMLAQEGDTVWCAVAEASVGEYDELLSQPPEGKH